MFETSEALAQAMAAAASNKKGRDIVLMDMRQVTLSTDYFIVCSGNADEIEDRLKEAGVEIGHKEGYREGEWILLDYGDCVAHVFTRDSREYYALEQLWGDAILTPYEDD